MMMDGRHHGTGYIDHGDSSRGFITAKGLKVLGRGMILTRRQRSLQGHDYLEKLLGKTLKKIL